VALTDLSQAESRRRLIEAAARTVGISRCWLLPLWPTVLELVAIVIIIIPFAFPR
jgi:hypothetical protein